MVSPQSSAILRSLSQASHFRRIDGREPRCTHAVKVTGRYHVHDLEQALFRCPNSTSIVVESANASFQSRQESMVLGFDTRWGNALFGWSDQHHLCLRSRCSIALEEDTGHRGGAVQLGVREDTQVRELHDRRCGPPHRRALPLPRLRIR